MTSALEPHRITTRRGLEGNVLRGGNGPDLVFFHGENGTTETDPFLLELTRSFTVHAPIWPGYGDDETETAIEDMLDFTLHGWDIVDALGLDQPPVLAGHSMGGMIAAEMACVARNDLSRLVLLSPLGLWDDTQPIPDLFAMLPFEMAETMFHDAALGEKLLTGGTGFKDNDALASFMVAKARRLGTAGKILFPIPNRRLSKRLHRIGAPTLLVWGEQDRFVDPSYGSRWSDAIVGSALRTVPNAGHMLHLEQPEATAQVVADWG